MRSLSPTPATGVAGFPAQCYPPGTGLTVTLTPAAGRIMTGWMPHSGGPGQTGSAPYSFTLSGPTNMLANTAAATPSLNWAVFSRAGGSLTMRAANVGTGTATNVRILAISGATNGFSYSGGVPPLTVAASLAAGDVQPFSLTFSRTGGTSLAAFSFTMTVEVNGGPPATVTINVP